ncbi:hypothetical protein ABKN59_000119 [Abortiporus biennis]
MSSHPIIIVTGANSGVGYGICQRLLVQLSQSVPPDALPQFRPLGYTIGQPEVQRYDGLTLIMACRSKHRALAARKTLLEFFDNYIEQEKQRPDYDGHVELFKKNLEINFHALDMASMHSVFQFGDEISQRYQYISHMICNGGGGTYNGMKWGVLIKQILAHPILALTVTEFKNQISGVTTDDGLGYVFQSNVFSHYALSRYLQPLFSSYSKLSSQPARILWTSSLESSPEDFSLEDWQLLKTYHSYETSKYEIDLVAHRLALQSQKDESSAVRHYIIHPGISHSNAAHDLVPTEIFNWFKVLLFYVARFFGSPNHTIEPFKAAISAVHLCLVATAFLPTTLHSFYRVDYSPTSNVFDDMVSASDIWPNGKENARATALAEERKEAPPIRFGSVTNRQGRESVNVVPIHEWEKHAADSEKLVDKMENLYRAYLKLEGESKVLKPVESDGSANGH